MCDLAVSLTVKLDEPCAIDYCLSPTMFYLLPYLRGMITLCSAVQK